jgi:hypothetical protein
LDAEIDLEKIEREKMLLLKLDMVDDSINRLIDAIKENTNQMVANKNGNRY